MCPALFQARMGEQRESEASKVDRAMSLFINLVPDFASAPQLFCRYRFGFAEATRTGYAAGVGSANN